MAWRNCIKKTKTPLYSAAGMGLAGLVDSAVGVGARVVVAGVVEAGVTGSLFFSSAFAARIEAVRAEDLWSVE